jgi:predicted esterase YcpF (UPF0227 family)
MLYVYLHGFNSAFNPEANKVRSISSLGEVTGITYDTFASYDEIFSHITSKVQNNIIDDITFVGTSLGGFWAAQMGKHYGCPSVIINPCHDPNFMLSRYESSEMKNYYSDEYNVLTREVIDSYKSKHICGPDKTYKYLPLVLLDMGDEVINSRETILTLNEFPMRCFKNGSHRFDHIEESIQYIREYLNHCGYVEHLNTSLAK